MPILTKPSLVKGTPGLVTLSRADIIAHPKVAASNHFKVDTNWSHLTAIFVSTVSNQTKVLTFKASIPSLSAEFRSTAAVDSSFKLVALSIHDLDGGTLTLKRTDLGASEAVVAAAFDLSFTPPGPSFLLNRDFNSPNTFLSNETPINGASIAGGAKGVDALNFNNNVKGLDIDLSGMGFVSGSSYKVRVHVHAVLADSSLAMTIMGAALVAQVGGQNLVDCANGPIGTYVEYTLIAGSSSTLFQIKQNSGVYFQIGAIQILAA